MDLDRDRVQQVVYDIIAADNRSDIQTVLSLYDSAALLMPPGKAVVHGIAAITKNYEEIFTNNRLRITTEIEEIRLEHFLAVVSGNNKGNVIARGNSVSKAMNSKYVMVLHKQSSGKWLIQRLIWNDNEAR